MSYTRLTNTDTPRTPSLPDLADALDWRSHEAP